MIQIAFLQERKTRSEENKLKNCTKKTKEIIKKCTKDGGIGTASALLILS
jgi:hypothetical protein